MVAIDVDEVLYPFLFEYSSWLPSVGLPSFDVSDMSGFGVSALLGLSREEGRRLEMRFLAEAGHVATPMVGSVDAVAVLSSRFELHAVTARVESVAGPATRLWLDRWFPSAFADVHLLFDDVDSVPRSKGEVCATLGAVALVDDSPANLESVSPGVAAVLLGSWPWSRRDDGRWYSARDWPDAVEYLLAL